MIACPIVLVDVGAHPTSANALIEAEAQAAESHPDGLTMLPILSNS